MKKEIFVYLFLLVLAMKLNAQSQADFIIISNVGDSHTSLEPTVICTDTVKRIGYDKDDFELRRKFYMYRDYIVSADNYNKLFSYLNIWSKPRERKAGFVRSATALLIIDYRHNDIDYELLTLKDVPGTMYTINSLYCYFSCNNFGKDLIHQMEIVYNFYTNFYDPYHEFYRTELICN